jgi:hypothetical protein
VPSSPKRGAPSAPAREEFIIEVKVDVEVSVKSHFVPIRDCEQLEDASRNAAKGRISSTTSMVRWGKDDGHERRVCGADDDSGYETAGAQVATTTKGARRVRSVGAAAMMMATVESVDCRSKVVRQPRGHRFRKSRHRRGDEKTACDSPRDWDQRSRGKKKTPNRSGTSRWGSASERGRVTAWRTARG